MKGSSFSNNDGDGGATNQERAPLVGWPRPLQQRHKHQAAQCLAAWLLLPSWELSRSASVTCFHPQQLGGSQGAGAARSRLSHPRDPLQFVDTETHSASVSNSIPSIHHPSTALEPMFSARPDQRTHTRTNNQSCHCDTGFFRPDTDGTPATPTPRHPSTPSTPATSTTQPRQP